MTVARIQSIKRDHCRWGLLTHQAPHPDPHSVHFFFTPRPRLHHPSPAGCAVWCSALASTMSARLLDGEGRAVFMATRLGRRIPAPLLLLVGVPLAVLLLMAQLSLELELTVAAAGQFAWALSCSCMAGMGCAGGVLAVLGPGAAAGEMAGKSAACTRPHAP